MTLQDRLQDAMKDAMRARDKPRLLTIRMLLAAIKQREIDERITLDDAGVLAVLDKQAKQRRESIRQYRDAGRDDLVASETFELDLIQSYLPVALEEDEIDRLIDTAIRDSGAASPRDMGKVMALIKPQVQGRADMAAVSARIKSRLHG